MGQHSVADAKNNLSKLIDLALAGEEVVITRHGQPVVEIRARDLKPLKRMSPEWLERLDRLRAQTHPSVEDAGTFVSRMRDEDSR